MVQVTRPLTVPERGPKTAQAILDLLRLEPALHRQRTWERDYIDDGALVQPGATETCGTTRCVGGWAIWLHHGSVQAATGDEDSTARAIAQELLGIDYEDAESLFYYTTETMAIAALEAIAEGRPINWDDIFHGNLDH